MDPRIERRAEELGELLAESTEYQALQSARESLSQHSAAQIMLRDMQQKQEKLRQKQMSGQQITDADIQDFQRTSQVVSMNPYVRELVDAEMAFSEMLTQVQRLLFKPVGLDMPEENAEDAEEADAEEDSALKAKAEEEEAARKARSRLWIPGQ